MSRRGSGNASAEVVFERTVNEAVRRARLLGINDPTFVPAIDEFQFMMSVRTFASHGAGAGAAGRRLTFGAHLTGGSYDGSIDVTIETDATADPDPETIVARDVNGFAALVRLILGDTGFIGDTGAGSLDIWPALAGGHVRVQSADFMNTNLDIDDDGNVIARGNLAAVEVAAAGPAGINSKTPVPAVVAPAAAGAAYGATEQAAINDLILRLTNFGIYI